MSLLILSALLSVAHVARAADDALNDSADDKVAVRSGHVNIRSSPNGPIIGRVKNGDSLDILHSGNSKWDKIEYNGQTAYIFNKYVNYSDEESGEGDEQPKAQATKPSEDAKTDATHCVKCEARRHQTKQLHKIPKRKIVQVEEPDTDEPRATSGKSTCWGRQLLNAAKAGQSWAAHTNRHYHPYNSGGACALGVHGFLQSAGFLGPGYDGHAGDADDYWKRPRQSTGNLERMGFKNQIGRYNAQNAPPGAVLVFAGPLTSEYERTGGYPPRGRRGGRGVGDWVGHITVKGDPGGGYYTDGHTSAPAIPNRRLVGVFVMENCKTCTANLRRKCGK